MVVLLICAVLLIVVLVVFRSAIYEAANRYTTAKILKYTVVVASVLWTVFLLYMGIGEVAGGDSSGSAHLITAIPFALIAYLLVAKPPTQAKRKR